MPLNYAAAANQARVVLCGGSILAYLREFDSNVHQGHVSVHDGWWPDLDPKAHDGRHYRQYRQKNYVSRGAVTLP